MRFFQVIYHGTIAEKWRFNISNFKLFCQTFFIVMRKGQEMVKHEENSPKMALFNIYQKSWHMFGLHMAQRL